MSARRRLAVLVGSAALHAAALAGVLVLAAGLRQPQPLFIDLTGGVLAGEARALSREAPLPGGRAPAATPAREARRASTRAAPPEAPLPRVFEPAPPAEGRYVPEPTQSISADARAADGPGSMPSPFPSAGEGLAARAGASDGSGRQGQPGGAASGSLLALAGPGAQRAEPPAEFGPYLARFRQLIQEFLVYPLAARRRGLSGRVEIEVLLEPTGRVGAVSLVTSSAHDMLDQAALEAVRSLPPVPMPEHLPRRTLRVRLPVIFELR